MNTATNDKILIKSEIDKKAKSAFMRIVGAFFGLFVIIILALLIIPHRRGNALMAAFKGHDTYMALLIVGCVFFLLGVIFGIVFLAISRCELTITEKNVRGKTLFGKEVVLPLYMVSAYSTRKLLSTVAVATSSGVTKFSLIGNYLAIGEILGQKINERQEVTANEVKPQSTQSNSMDDILKLKSLLDAGVITQEEFDAKKKQLLGL